MENQKQPTEGVETKKQKTKRILLIVSILAVVIMIDYVGMAWTLWISFSIFLVIGIYLTWRHWAEINQLMKDTREIHSWKPDVSVGQNTPTKKTKTKKNKVAKNEAR